MPQPDLMFVILLARPVRARDFRFGSKADIGVRPRHVRSTPKSGHWNSVVECPLCANSGHSALVRFPLVGARAVTTARQSQMLEFAQVAARMAY